MLVDLDDVRTLQPGRSTDAEEPDRQNATFVGCVLVLSLKVRVDTSTYEATKNFKIDCIEAGAATLSTTHSSSPAQTRGSRHVEPCDRKAGIQGSPLACCVPLLESRGIVTTIDQCTKRQRVSCSLVTRAEQDRCSIAYGSPQLCAADYRPIACCKPCHAPRRRCAFHFQYCKGENKQPRCAASSSTPLTSP